jgi:hypothetical protein
VKRVRVEQRVEVGAPAAKLWSYITDWSRHGEWIPLTRVETVGGSARGVGGRIRAWSGIGPIGFWDPLTVTEWHEDAEGGGRAALVHTGRLVRGDAEITVTATGPEQSTLRWVEHFDLGRPGALGWRLGGRPMEQALGRALKRMAAIVEGS